ncbi:MAG TPA: hypothetical protein VGQ55_09075 [Pyrinomonadaceae bacterium]|jgi:hypothetical protein|nr:hypothetical protein [Pyrinomonadaceae bacterium]
MKKVFILTGVVFLFATAAFAQKATDFSGTWTLDVSKSKLDERARIESMTLTVAQTDKDVKVDSKTTRAPRPEGEQPRMGGGGGMGRGGGFGGGDSSMTYSLDGKESKVTQESQMGSVPVTLAGKLNGEKLSLSSTRVFNGPMGEVTLTTKENWTLSDGGKTLTVAREQTTPRGTTSSTLVFEKK